VATKNISKNKWQMANMTKKLRFKMQFNGFDILDTKCNFMALKYQTQIAILWL
jgi:hypothetical protein